MARREPLTIAEVRLLLDKASAASKLGEQTYLYLSESGQEHRSVIDIVSGEDQFGSTCLVLVDRFREEEDWSLQQDETAEAALRQGRPHRGCDSGERFSFFDQ